MCNKIKFKSQCSFTAALLSEFARIFQISATATATKKIIATLDDFKIQRYFTFKSSQPLKMVIHGLDRDTKNVDISEALTSLKCLHLSFSDDKL